jgi:hypothetical protein
LRLQCGMPCSKLEVSTVQHGTLSGAGYLHQSPMAMEVPQSHLWVGGAQATRDANLEPLTRCWGYPR